jgi:hypothetical protein
VAVAAVARCSVCIHKKLKQKHIFICKTPSKTPILHVKSLKKPHFLCKNTPQNTDFLCKNTEFAVPRRQLAHDADCQLLAIVVQRAGDRVNTQVRIQGKGTEFGEIWAKIGGFIGKIWGFGVKNWGF